MDIEIIKSKILNSINHTKHTGKDGVNYVGHWMHLFDDFQVKAPCNNNDCRVIYKGSEILRIDRHDFSDILKERERSLIDEFLT